MDRNGFWSHLWSWMAALAADHNRSRPVMVGLSAPQGAGKTTLTAELCRRAKDDGLQAAGISIDDFYLTHAEQQALAAANPGNPYLQHRGYPGTHDLELGLATLRSLRTINPQGEVALPSYDKGAFSGEGDRRPKKEWPHAKVPLDIVIVEGWMLGFTSLDPAKLTDPNMRAINGYLPNYAPWHDCLDALIWLEPEDPRFMLRWRAEAEENAKRAGLPGMSREGVDRFAATFLPAYLTYLPGMAKGVPIKGPMLHVVIGEDRLPKA